MICFINNLEVGIDFFFFAISLPQTPNHRYVLLYNLCNTDNAAHVDQLHSTDTRLGTVYFFMVAQGFFSSYLCMLHNTDGMGTFVPFATLCETAYCCIMAIQLFKKCPFNSNSMYSVLVTVEQEFPVCSIATHDTICS